jgi:hypothetical protein
MIFRERQQILTPSDDLFSSDSGNSGQHPNQFSLLKKCQL